MENTNSHLAVLLLQWKIISHQPSLTKLNVMHQYIPRQSPCVWKLADKPDSDLIALHLRQLNVFLSYFIFHITVHILHHTVPYYSTADVSKQFWRDDQWQSTSQADSATHTGNIISMSVSCLQDMSSRTVLKKKDIPVIKHNINKIHQFLPPLVQKQ